MDVDPKDAGSDTSKTDWVWIPNTSYGPFTFGAHRSSTSHLGALIERSKMSPVDYVADYESERGDIDLSFWNDYLTSVSVRDTFVINGAELIGARFNDVRHLIEEEPQITDLVLTISASFDAHNMMWFMDLDWRITEIKAGLNPDTVPSPPLHGSKAGRGQPEAEEPTD